MSETMIKWYGYGSAKDETYSVVRSSFHIFLNGRLCERSHRNDGIAL